MMKNNLILFILLISLSSCKKADRPAQPPVTIGALTYASYGAPIDAQSLMSMQELASAYTVMSPSDSVNAKFKGAIKEVCSKKGCWMTLDMGAGTDLMVRFKDYGFFMPLDAKGTVIVSGKAFVSETSVEELKHYAEDAGASEAAIEAIVSPENSYSFEVVGVLLAI